MPSKGHQWNQLRAAYKQQCKQRNLPCWICGKPINYQLTGSHPQAFTADHITPTSYDGQDRTSNLKPAHFSCNSSRGNTTRGQFPTSRKWLTGKRN